jgi:tetratricopeptide (TPR) repeat protein
VHNPPSFLQLYPDKTMSLSNLPAPSPRLAGVSALCMALWLAGCASLPGMGSSSSSSDDGSTQATPAVAPAPAAPVAPPPPPTASQQQQAQKIALSAVDLLEAGNEPDARIELQRALAIDPANKLALNLMRQMNEDPFTLLGRESFPYNIRAGESLSKVAGRFLGDVYLFHALAKYNSIKVPRQVGEGQTIRVPGKAPAPERAEPRRAARDVEPAPAPAPPAAPAAPPPPPEPTLAERAMRAGDTAAAAGNWDKAYAEYRQAAGLGLIGATAKADAAGKRLVDQHSRNARNAMARQDLDGAIRAWDRVLELDPSNETARLERQKALRLKEKVKAL